MKNGMVFRGNLYCTLCLREDKGPGRPCTNLYVQEDGSYAAYCWSHTKDLKEQGKKPDRDNLAITEECFHIPWRNVVKLTIHKPDPNSFERTGDVITIEMKDVPNTDLMRSHAIEVAHALQLMSDTRATIHHWTEGTEQNDCWTDNNHCWTAPATAAIRDKYWGRTRVAAFHKVCRMMCRVHKWQLVDETVPLLDRIVEAIDEGREEL
jgi:hypothetical protein